MLTTSKWLKAAYGLLVTAVILAMFPKYSYNDPDTFWHIELGQYMIRNHTVLHHAIHTFYGDRLPYIPHEFGFQLVAAGLYMAFGWPGVYLLTAFCLFLLILGLLQMAKISRRELGFKEDHPLLLPFVLLISVWIYYNYFKGRPQMVSSWMIVWFFVYLRRFQIRPLLKPAAAMLALSLGIANFHAGVWLVIVVFTGMAVLEAWIARKLDKRRMFVFAGVVLAGLPNPGGIKSLLYILTVSKNNFNMLINEWQPIAFGKWDTSAMTLLLLFFALTLPFSLYRKPFRFFLMLGILYLGVSNFKQNLFMWLFIPYFAGAFFEAFPWMRKADLRLKPWIIKTALAGGLLINCILNFTSPPAVSARSYPVDEMAYILKYHTGTARPKVLAPYGSSGYVMYRGGDVLCDGRQDPFITRESLGAYGWTAFERSMYGFSDALPDIAAYDKPEYIIVRSNASTRLFEGWRKAFGEPVYRGRFGSVFFYDGGKKT
ncbi:hypothetical protein G5B47_00300 [Paenibacillus sp. 7124]|uniref:Glycosyltransferase RgtA/B/C/D-like domain-containing protein n=1 Tax=Paenibacillus apii TaxID=1850370 RepID=A0A6M1PFX3_9BACL|nr:hypothetical protein [Paenibacillus apii]NGM80843.1 hypothetical protein [Paenibacillus apii]NJJ40807.1 hypothetical protein [Paenibacillus apii]